MISAVILAAGASSRMGEPKPLVSVAGRPMLDHVLSAVRGSRVKDIVVVLGASADRVRKSASIDGARTIVNEAYADGMSTSIRAGVRAAGPQAEAFLIVLGDEPFVTSSTIDSLLDGRGSSGAKIFIPTYRGRRGNPVLVDRELAEEMQSITGDQGCRAIFGHHGEQILEVPVNDPGILIDLDTPEQVARSEAAIREGQPLECLLGDIADHGAHPHSIVSADLPIARPDILSLAQELRSRNEPFVLATVVRVDRPSSGRPGFKAIVRPNREIIGWLGGSCAQSVLVAESLRALRDGKPQLVRLRPDSGLTLPSEGVVEHTMECESGGAMDIYVEPNMPKPRLIVIGDSPVAGALRALGRLLDFRTIAVAPGAPEGSLSGADEVVRDLADIPALIASDAYVVVATMGKYDETALKEVAHSTAAYVGLVASRRRAAAVLKGLEAAGASSDTRRRIRSPAGLDLAAETPEEIALSIMAEITQVRRTSKPVELSVTEAPAVAGESGTTLDLVCGMDVPRDGPISTAYGGRTFVFCSEGCRSRFVKSPEAFLA
jgi:xanthine dehydrogenase accessory factor